MDNKILKLDAFTCNSSNVKQHETNIIKRLQALYPFKMNEWFKTNDFESVRKIVVAELFKNN